MEILLSWIGRADLNCALNNNPQNIGPIAQALQFSNYSQVFLLNNYMNQDLSIFSTWISTHSKANIKIQSVPLSSPTNHTEIYENVRKILSLLIKKYPEAKLTFHTSPGTPAMALTWMLLSPVYGAKLIESSIEAGVKPVLLPFEISAYFLPDQELTKLTGALTPIHPAFHDIIHKSEIMSTVIKQAQYVAPRDITVLIEGESGTGKEVFARAIHGASRRADKPFVAVNCGAFPGELIESVLFGYEKGAFTGANKATNGIFHDANGGTLFLDELGELPQKAQVALLRVLQEQKVSRIGTSKTEDIDVRIIAATNRNLIDEVAKGNFRSDLFYRVAVACLYIPPLRKRKEDILILLDDAVKLANERIQTQANIKHKIFSDSAKKIMLSHPWSGNVRELYNTVTRALLWSTEDIISEETARQSLFQMPKENSSILEHELGNGFSLPNLLNEITCSYIKRAEEASHGNKKKATELLGLKSYQNFTNWKEKCKK